VWRESASRRAPDSARAGRPVIAQGTTDKQWNEKPRFIPAVVSPEFSRVFVIDYSGRGARYNVLDILHGEEGRDFTVWSID